MRRYFSLFFGSVFLALIFSSSDALADVIYKKNSHLEGEIIQETDKKITLLINGGTVEFDRSEITKIERNSERDGSSDIFHYSGGMVQYVEYMDANNSPLTKPIFIQGSNTTSNGTETVIEIAFESFN